MAVNGQLIDAIVHEYLLKKDKSLAQVFQHKTKAVCTYLLSDKNKNYEKCGPGSRSRHTATCTH